MNTPFDPYHRWLGIPPKQQPANYYRLLGLEQFESDLEVIRDAVEQRMAHIRTYQLGSHAELSQKILNELAAAAACLGDPTKRAEYDRQLLASRRLGWLRRILPPPTKAVPPGQRLLGNGAIPPPLPVREGPPSVPDKAARLAQRRRWILWPALVIGGLLLAATAISNLSRREQVESRPSPMSDVTEPDLTAVVHDFRPAKLAQMSNPVVEPGKSVYLSVNVSDPGTAEGRLQFSLELGAPRGATIDPDTGIFTWAVAAGQPPGEYPITILAARSSGGGPECAASFRVLVRRQRQLPVLASIDNHSLEVGVELMFPLTVTNPNDPSTHFTYSLVRGPESASVDQRTGFFRWKPAANQAGKSYTITVRASDTQDVSLAAEKSFTVRVVGARPTVAAEQTTAIHGSPPREPSPPPASGTFSAEDARKHQDRWAKHLNVPLEFVNGIGMKLVLIPPGEFVMGSPDTDEDASNDERPTHLVRMSRPFYMGVYVVTQEEYQRTMGNNPSYFCDSGDGKKQVLRQNTDRFPVEQVSWNDAAEFCRRLSALPGEKAAQRTYRLPTEAEWEYAARAGTTTMFHFGDALNGRQANCDGRKPYGTRDKGPFLARTTAVGSYSPNSFGLYDVHGNVYQWCADYYDLSYYFHSPADDPGGPIIGSNRVRRGGSWEGVAYSCNSTGRSFSKPSLRLNIIGFRVVCSVTSMENALPKADRLSTPATTVVASATGAASSVVPNPLSAALPPDFAMVPFDKVKAKQHQWAWSQYCRTPLQIVNTLGMKLTLIPPGEFLMGSDDSEGRRSRDESPQHRVRITKPFYLSICEVTQADYLNVMGSNPSFCSANGDGKARVSGIDTKRFPVEQIPWYDAMEFCRRLTTREGREYRLPTEAEWEFACQAGTSTPFNFGSTLNGREANVNGTSPYGTGLKGPNLSRATNVGSYQPNAFGLYDMHGNVREWCADWYDPAYYAASPSDNPTGPLTGSTRVIRGGSWELGAAVARSAARDKHEVNLHNDDVGFRVILTVKSPDN